MLRQAVAEEAARIMREQGIDDFLLAKRKAADRLGVTDASILPRNTEIEAALVAHQRLFASDRHEADLATVRRSALEAMRLMADFQPRLVGPVLEGTADAHSAVALHLHSDDPDAVPRWLDEHGIPAQSRSRHLRLDREREGDFPIWLFSAENLSFDVTVLPADVVRQAPLSGIDGKPMRRASAAQLRALLAEDEIAGYEGS